MPDQAGRYLMPVIVQAFPAAPSFYLIFRSARPRGRGHQNLRLCPSALVRISDSGPTSVSPAHLPDRQQFPARLSAYFSFFFLFPSEGVMPCEFAGPPALNVCHLIMSNGGIARAWRRIAGFFRYQPFSLQHAG
jgi:hypothetical protein